MLAHTIPGCVIHQPHMLIRDNESEAQSIVDLKQVLLGKTFGMDEVVVLVLHSPDALAHMV